jgi:hypothetical protein
MTVTAAALQGVVALGTTDPTEGNGKYTSPALTTSIINTASGYNSSAGAIVVTVNIVRSGGAIAAGNIALVKSIATGATDLFPELINKVLG